MPSHSLHPAIRRAIARFRRRMLLIRGARTLGTIAAASGGAFSVALLVDRHMILSDGQRLAVTTIAVLVASGVTLRALGRLCRSLRALPVARTMERLSPELDESVISSVQLTLESPGGREGVSADLLGALQDSTAARLGELRPEARLRASSAWIAVAAGISIWIVIGMMFIAFPRSLAQLAARFFHPATALPRPSTVELDIHPGHAVLATGSQVTVSAELVHGSAGSGAIAWRAEGETDVAEAILPFRRDAGVAKLVRSFPPLEKTLEYRFTAGDFQSPWYRIEIRDPPEPRRFRFTFEYPEYTRRPDETRSTRGGAFRVLEGTAVSIEIEASEPLAGAEIRLIEAQDSPGGPSASSPQLPLTVRGREAVLEGLPVHRGLAGYELRLDGSDGVVNADRLRYPVEVTPDRPPSIELTSPRSEEISVEPASLIDLGYRARDDVGLSRVLLTFRPEAEDDGSSVSLTLYSDGEAPGERDSSGSPIAADPQVAPPPRQSVETTYRLDVSTLALEPGATVPFVLEATDLAGERIRTRPRRLRAVFNPLYPEGPEWPSRLSTLEGELESLLVDWKALGPMPEGSVRIDAATFESYRARAESTIDLLSRLRRGSDRLTDLGRSIAIASPQRRTLELLARNLRTVGLRSGGDFWTELHELLSLENASKSGAGTAAAADRVSFDELTRLYRATGSVLETSWIDLRALHRSEALEEALEESHALARDQESLFRAWSRDDGRTNTDPGRTGRDDFIERQQNLLRQATRVGAHLTTLAESGGRGDARLETLARAYLQNAVVPLDELRSALARGVRADIEAAARAALARLPWAVQDLVDARRQIERQVNDTRWRLEQAEPASHHLESLRGLLERATGETAPASVDGEALGAILRAFDDLAGELREELATVENMAYADLETVIDLSSILRILDESRRDILLGGRETFFPEEEGFPEEDGELSIGDGSRVTTGDSTPRQDLEPVRDRIGKVARAYRDTAVSRRLGRGIQNLDLVASSEGELVSHLRGAAPWKLREVRFHARCQEEILGALDYVRTLLGHLREGGDLNQVQAELLRDRLNPPLSRLDRAASGMQEVVSLLAFSLSGPAPSGDGTRAGDPAQRLLSSRAEARRALLEVDEAISELEALRREILATDLAGAAAARRWLRDERGALAARVQSLADRESRHSDQVKAAAEALAGGGGRRGSDLLVEHEELRSATRDLARQAGREAAAARDAAASEGRPDPERARRLDRAAGRLRSIADRGMRAASRALYRAEEAPESEAGDSYLEASALEDQAADALRALAQTLGTLESDEALEDLTAELNELLQSGSDGPAADERSVEELLAEARLLLEKSREAATRLAARLAASPRYVPVVEALRSATEHLQAAVAAAEEGARELAEQALGRGREKLREAARLAREIRGEHEELLRSAEEDLATEAGGEKASPAAENEALRREVEEMLAKLQAMQALQREVDELFRDIVGADEGDDAAEEIDRDKAQKLTDAAQRVLDEMGERFMTMDQLVDLVARLLQIERDGSEMAGEERGLAQAFRELPRDAGSGDSGARARGLRELAGEQTALARRGEELVDRFTKTGFRLTANLPQVLTSYWRAGDAAGEVVESQRTARTGLATLAAEGAPDATDASGAESWLLDAGRAIDRFLERLRQTRQVALKAITELESGIEESTFGQRQIESSRSSLSEAMEMLRRGDVKQAQAAHRQSMRSLAQATHAIRKGASFELFSAGEGDGRLTDTSDDFDWKILTRGDESLEALEFKRKGVLELPYPAQFRELVRLYLRALSERGL